MEHKMSRQECKELRKKIDEDLLALVSTAKTLISQAGDLGGQARQCLALCNQTKSGSCISEIQKMQAAIGVLLPALQKTSLDCQTEITLLDQKFDSFQRALVDMSQDMASEKLSDVERYVRELLPSLKDPLDAMVQTMNLLDTHLQTWLDRLTWTQKTPSGSAAQGDFTIGKRGPV